MRGRTTAAEACGPGLLRARLRSQGLAGPPLGSGRDGPLAVAERLLAVQAQDPRGARLAIRARTRGCRGADIDRALSAAERSLVVTWLNRGTLHLVAAGDYALLQVLCTPQLRVAVDARLAQCGIDARCAGRAVGLVDGWLADDGPLGRAELRERLLSAGVSVEGQGLVHVLVRASLDGVLVRGPVEHGSPTEQLYARVADWLPEATGAMAHVRADRDRALGELARRFLIGHAPASDRDLAKWAGLALRDARAGLSRVAAALSELPDGLVELRRSGPDARARARLPPPRLLGAFEPLLMGWCSRALVLGEHDPDVVSGGIFRGFAFARGRPVGVWRFAGARVGLAPFEELPEPLAAALARDGAAVLRFLGR